MEEERKKHEKKSYFRIIKENAQELISKLIGKNKKEKKNGIAFKDAFASDEIFDAIKDVEGCGEYMEIEYTEERYFLSLLYEMMMDDRGPRFASNEERTKIVYGYLHEDKEYDDFSEQGIKELYALHMFLDITGTSIPDLTYIHHEGHGSFLGFEYAFDGSHKTIEELVKEKGIEFRYAKSPKADYEYYIIGEQSSRNGYYKRRGIESIIRAYDTIFPEYCKRIRENIAKWSQEVVEKESSESDEQLVIGGENKTVRQKHG